MTLESKFSIQIQKSPREVFEGIVDPTHMTQYFISESSGRMETGKELLWKFPEFEQRFPITEVKTEEHKFISFVWDPQTVVQISLAEMSDGSTLVEATEGSKPLSEENLAWALGNTGGWSNFLACLKAYLEYGIQLRKGAFEFMRENNSN